MAENIEKAVWQALDRFQNRTSFVGICEHRHAVRQIPPAGAATSIEEKFADAAQVQQFTGACPSLALHVLWDFSDGVRSVTEIERLANKYAIRAGAINPNLFQDQQYKYGSLGNLDPDIRKQALRHLVDSVEIAKAQLARYFALVCGWVELPGSREHKAFAREWFIEGLRATHTELSTGQQRCARRIQAVRTGLLSHGYCRLGHGSPVCQGCAGSQGKVLVDTGHHYQGTNIEQIVAWLLSENMLGGFHFNDRRYADDDLTIGSIDPYQVFRIFHEIRSY